MSQSVFIFEAVWVLTTSSIKNMFRIVLIPVFIIKNVVGRWMNFCYKLFLCVPCNRCGKYLFTVFVGQTMHLRLSEIKKELGVWICDLEIKISLKL